MNIILLLITLFLNLAFIIYWIIVCLKSLNILKVSFSRNILLFFAKLKKKAKNETQKAE